MTNPADWRALCAELVSIVEHHAPAHIYDLPYESAAMRRARTLLSQPKPKLAAASSSDRAAIVARLRQLARAVTFGPEAVARECDMRIPAEPLRDADFVLSTAADLLSQPEPEEVTDEELDDQFFEHCYTDDFGNELMERQQFRKGARAVLARYPRPTIQPERDESVMGRLIAAPMDSRGYVDLRPGRTALSQPEPESAATQLGARSLLERVARMADCIGQQTVAEIAAISNQAAAWLNANPPGQP